MACIYIAWRKSVRRGQRDGKGKVLSGTLFKRVLGWALFGFLSFKLGVCWVWVNMSEFSSAKGVRCYSYCILVRQALGGPSREESNVSCADSRLAPLLVSVLMQEPWPCSSRVLITLGLGFRAGIGSPG